MSFRRSKDRGIESSHWRLKHRGELIECGIPQLVADSDRAWRYLLLHGDDAPGTGWIAGWLSPVQAQRLLALIERDLDGEGFGYDILTALRAHLGGSS